jgi:spore coat protein A
MKIRKLICTAGAAFLLLATGRADAVQSLLDGSLIPKFVEPLPVAGDITVVNATNSALTGVSSQRARRAFPIAAEEFQSQILPTAANWDTGDFEVPEGCSDTTASWVWGYLTPRDNPGRVRPSYLGPVVVAEKGVPFMPLYLNRLPFFGHVQQNLPIDMTLDWANPDGIDCGGDGVNDPYTNDLCGELPYMGEIPIASHLHGGEIAPSFDGGPDAWFTQNWRRTGSGWPGRMYTYPNDQQESTIWFHDHALGITRLNVYAGLAGAYPIIDPDNPPLATMPAFPQYDIPLIIQDRSFDTNCEIFYNLASNPQPNPDVHPFWIPEFIGDTIVVNGRTWPYLNVEPRQYRFRFINGSNARFYNLSLSDGSPFIAIATDDGYLVNAVETTNLIIAPGERYEVVVDFEGHEDENITLMNSARTPFPDGDDITVGGTDTVMQFRVNVALNEDIADSDIANNTPIRPTPLLPIVNAYHPSTGSIIRQLTLNEVLDGEDPLELVVNNSKFNQADILPGCSTPLCRETELPAVGDTEIWEIVNISADAHPMHTHLVSFQILKRIPFYYDVAGDDNDYGDWLASYEDLLDTNGVGPGEGPPNQYNQKNLDGAIGGNPAVYSYLNFGAQRDPSPYERGWKDVVIAYPGEVTRIVVRWDTTDTPVASTAAAAAAAVGTSNYPFDPTELQGGVGYVYHCHIIDHEDNEMMRNYVVRSARQLVVPYAP